MLKDAISRSRENINIRLYQHRIYVIRSLHVASILVSLVTITSIIYQHGFPQTPSDLRLTDSIIEFSLIFYLIKFAIRIFYEFHPINFLKQNKFEAYLLLLIVVDEFASLFTGEHIVQQLMRVIDFPGIHT
jgi:hypothetical protein